MIAFSRFRKNILSTTSWLSNGSIVLKKYVHKNINFIPRHVLIVSKVSRYQVERIRESQLSDDDFKRYMIERGTDYQRMVETHEKNKNVQEQVVKTLKKLNIQYILKNRLTIEKFDFDWADFVISIGGDGTFLLAANLIFDNKKPVIGINSDPDMSEGYLMLDRYFTNNISRIFDKLKNGEFEYLMRTRIRVTLEGDGIWGVPFHMHEKARICGQEIFCTNDKSAEAQKTRRLPWLALNEVFIGESLSARTSSLKIKINDSNDYYQVKSSGVCVSTGTGSSSWYRAINSMTTQMLRDIVQFVDPNKNYTDEEADKICNQFNESLLFPPDDLAMSYAIRDIIMNEIWPLPKKINPRDFCNKLTIKSQCYDAGLVFDGGIGIPFNMDTTAILETHPEDKLRTIKFLD